MIDTYLGKKGLEYSWQEEWQETTICPDCKGDARLAFVAFESPDITINWDVYTNAMRAETFVCSLYHNEGKGGFWPHDCIAIAVYFCRECFHPTTLFNQA